MGRKRGMSSGAKVGSGQVRLDQMLTPRRSTRRRSGTLEKQTIASGSKKVVELKNDPPILEIEDDQEKTITLQTEDKPKRGHRVEDNKAKKAVSQPKKGVQKISKDRKNELLKCFDLNPTYGPCRGITRRERYLRALKYEIQPCPEKLILEILDEHKDDFTFQSCIWDQNELLKTYK